MKLWRALLWIGLGLFAALAGYALWARGILAKYGPPDLHTAYGVVPANYQPKAQILDFTYTPASPIHAGEVLTLTITMTDSDALMQPTLAVGNPPCRAKYFLMQDADEGEPPDLVAGDDIYTFQVGTEDWPKMKNRTLLRAYLLYPHRKIKQVMAAPPLTVLPEDNVGP